MVRGEISAQETVIHCFKCLLQGFDAVRVDFCIESNHFENRQIVIPKLNTRIEYQPALLCLLAQLDCFNYVR
jgi:hypothetical protein